MKASLPVVAKKSFEELGLKCERIQSQISSITEEEQMRMICGEIVLIATLLDKFLTVDEKNVITLVQAEFGTLRINSFMFVLTL